MSYKYWWAVDAHSDKWLAMTTTEGDYGQRTVVEKHGSLPIDNMMGATEAINMLEALQRVRTVLETRQARAVRSLTALQTQLDTVDAAITHGRLLQTF